MRAFSLHRWRSEWSGLQCIIAPGNCHLQSFSLPAFLGQSCKHDSDFDARADVSQSQTPSWSQDTLSQINIYDSFDQQFSSYLGYNWQLGSSGTGHLPSARWAEPSPNWHIKVSSLSTRFRVMCGRPARAGPAITTQYWGPKDWRWPSKPTFSGRGTLGAHLHTPVHPSRRPQEKKICTQ
jgi:hypothetical protein